VAKSAVPPSFDVPCPDCRGGALKRQLILL
jgi:hypothetical protein